MTTLDDPWSVRCPVWKKGVAIGTPAARTPRVYVTLPAEVSLTSTPQVSPSPHIAPRRKCVHVGPASIARTHFQCASPSLPPSLPFVNDAQVAPSPPCHQRSSAPLCTLRRSDAPPGLLAVPAPRESAVAPSLFEAQWHDPAARGRPSVGKIADPGEAPTQ